MRKQKLTNLLLCIIGTELVGALSGIMAGGNFAGYYRSLRLPPCAPPGWLFPVAWAVLYALMGMTAYLIYSTPHRNRRKALMLYGVQLLVNFLWTPIFFGLHFLAGAVIVILLLLVLVVLMIVRFLSIRRLSAWLNVPYLLWVMYASFLTIGIWVLN